MNSGIHDLCRSSARPRAATARQEVSISKWVNERAPPWDDILTAHDVARLTRRHRWHLSALMWIGRFPAQQRFRGRRLGWLRSDVVNWLAKELSTRNHQHGPGVQQRLPFRILGAWSVEAHSIAAGDCRQKGTDMNLTTPRVNSPIRILLHLPSGLAISRASAAQ